MDAIVDQLTKLFESDKNCLMAYLFGSHAKGKANKESVMLSKDLTYIQEFLESVKKYIQ